MFLFVCLCVLLLGFFFVFYLFDYGNFIIYLIGFSKIFGFLELICFNKIFLILIGLYFGSFDLGWGRGEV